MTTLSFVLMVAFLSPGRIASFKYAASGVIHESSIRVIAIRTTSSKFEKCAKTSSSALQGYGALEAKFPRASSNFVN